MEPLHVAPRRAVLVAQRSDEPIGATQPLRKQGRIIASDRQAAARGRAIWRERSDDGVAAGDKGPIHDPQIGVLIGSLGQEMERGPIMPDGLCCTNPARDSSPESSVVAGVHEQTHTVNLQDQELAGLQ